MKHKINIKYLTIIFSVLILTISKNVNAMEYRTDEINSGTYVIGTHMFNRMENPELGYKGRLTTNLIMLASKTIESEQVDDMIIYYKKSNGTWINGLTGISVEVPETFEINYKNLKLEEVNNTVSAPVSPILFSSGPLAYNETEDKINYQIYFLYDDIENYKHDVFGIELEILDYNKEVKTLERDYYLDSKRDVTSFPKRIYGMPNNIILNRLYGIDFLSIDNIIDGTVSISARTFTKDKNNKKIYSDWTSLDITPEFMLPDIEIINKQSNPEYLFKNDEYSIYSLEINELEPYIFNVKPEMFGYEVYEESEDGTNKSIGIFKYGDKFNVNIKNNSIKKYTAKLGYFNKNNEFIVKTNSTLPLKEYIIDTRKLTAPIIDYHTVSTDNPVDFIGLNEDFYSSQAENTIDFAVNGIEIYRVYLMSNNEINMELVSNGEITSNYTIDPKNGVSKYVARVSAINANEEIVYSDFSNPVIGVTTPKINATELIDGKTIITLSNLKKYSQLEGISFELHTVDENSTDNIVETKVYDKENELSFELNVNQNITTYVKAFSNKYNYPNKDYSGDSNKILISVK